MLRTTYASHFPEIVVNNYDEERSEFGTIEIRQTSRHSEIWGHPATDRTSCNGSYAQARAHLLKFEKWISKKIKMAKEKLVDLLGKHKTNGDGDSAIV